MLTRKWGRRPFEGRVELAPARAVFPGAGFWESNVLRFALADNYNPNN